jgi:hypothetical protein
MIHGIPLYIGFLFILTTGITAGFLVRAFHGSTMVSVLITLWLVIQSILAMNGFYLKENSIPPRLAAAVIPPLLIILYFLASRTGRKTINKVNVPILTLMHVIRIPVEICLYLLFIHKAVPGLMTFEGRNFDIFSGITAPLAWYFGYRKPVLPRIILVAWNLICLGLVLNVVIQGILSAPTVFQKLAFDQPNIAVLYFPFQWLPAFVVPAVIFSHLICLRDLFVKKESVHS